MRIVFIGTGEFGVPALLGLRRAGQEIVAALSQPDRPAGRGLQIQPTPIRIAAEQHGIRHIQTPDINTRAPVEVDAGAEIAVVVAFGQKIGPSWLNAFPHGCVNIHASLLPRYRGAAPYQWAIINGDATTGVTVFRLNERWDAGPILGQRETPIGATETADELHDRLASIGAELIADVVARLEAGAIAPQTQVASAATRAPKLTKTDSLLDWTRPAFELTRRINGLWSWPTAVSQFESPGKPAIRLQLARAECIDEVILPTSEQPPATINPDGSVQTGRGRLRLLEVKPAGGKRMQFAAFANGRRLESPGRLVTPSS